MFPNHAVKKIKSTLVSTNNSIPESANLLLSVPAPSGTSDGHQLQCTYGEFLFRNSNSDDSDVDDAPSEFAVPLESTSTDQQTEDDLKEVCCIDMYSS